MSNFRLKYFHLIFAQFITSVNILFGQIPDFSKVPVLHDGDSLNITNLINNGVKITNGKVIAWFPKDSVSFPQMHEITDMINKGIKATEKFIHAPLPWQLHKPDEPYTFYFRPDRFISHASQAGFVSIPFWRIKNGKAPWLHEAIHEMLDTQTGSWFSPGVTTKDFDENMPLWLFEGVADYISLKISLIENLPFFDVFSNDVRTDTDSLFVNEIRSERGSYILSFIGSGGLMPELSSKDRIRYAPAFYHGSSSFVKYLSNSYGIQVLLTSVSLFRKELETIEKLTGKPLVTLKKEWLNKFRLVE